MSEATTSQRGSNRGGLGGNHGGEHLIVLHSAIHRDIDLNQRLAAACGGEAALLAVRRAWGPREIQALSAGGVNGGVNPQSARKT
jgi:hypothetical protein